MGSGEIDGAIVQRSPNDRAHDAFPFDRAQCPHIVQGTDPTGGDDRNGDGLRQANRGLDIHTLHHAIAADVGVDDGLHPVALKNLCQIDHVVLG